MRKQTITYSDWIEFVEWHKGENLDETLKSNIRMAKTRFERSGFNENDEATALKLMYRADYIDYLSFAKEGV